MLTMSGWVLTTVVIAAAGRTSAATDRSWEFGEPLHVIGSPGDEDHVAVGQFGVRRRVREILVRALHGHHRDPALAPQVRLAERPPDVLARRTRLLHSAKSSSTCM